MNRRTPLFALLAAWAATPASAAPEGSATLPLDRVIELHAAGAAATPTAPPVAATLDRFVLSGRIVDDVVEGRAAVQVTVLGDGWVEVPVMRLSPGVELTTLPTLSKASITVRDGVLVFVCQSAEVHHFDVGLRLSAGEAGAATLETLGATISTARVSHDTALYRVDGPGARREGDATFVPGRGGALSLAWSRVAPRPDPAPAAAASEAAEPVAPTVTGADAAIVLTLDGRRIARYRYAVSLERPATLELDIPPDQVVTRLFVNGRPRPVALDGRRLTVSVAAAREGDTEATFELVTRQSSAALSLAGRLRFEMPGLPLGVDELRVALYVPPVFTYRWIGGSLAPREAPALPAFAWSMPTPGQVHGFGQHLVLGRGDLELAYTVDLADRYYR